MDAHSEDWSIIAIPVLSVHPEQARIGFVKLSNMKDNSSTHATSHHSLLAF